MLSTISSYNRGVLTISDLGRQFYVALKSDVVEDVCDVLLLAMALRPVEHSARKRREALAVDLGVEALEQLVAQRLEVVDFHLVVARDRLLTRV